MTPSSPVTTVRLKLPLSVELIVSFAAPASIVPSVGALITVSGRKVPEATSGQSQLTSNVAPGSGWPVPSTLVTRSAPPMMKQAGPAFRFDACASLGDSVDGTGQPLP